MMDAIYGHSAVNDTIAAIATPPGVAGLAVVRISGHDAISCAASVFSGADLRTVASHTAHHGSIRASDGNLLDDVLATVFHAPRSYTGEHSVEISCHGGGVASRFVLERLLATGSRMAAPGEFTRRAFLNGRMDLAQAEAVADLIHAQTHEAHRASLLQLEGRLSIHVTGIRDALLHCLGMLELSLDFVEEDVEFLTHDKVRADIDAARTMMRNALASYASGRIVRDGVRVVLLGKPNVGKSSMLNAVLGIQRAIVTDLPGTTRDFIEEQVMLHGRQFRFIDTAGLRESADLVEQLGIAAGAEQLRRADIVCGIIDAPDDLTDLAELRAHAQALETPFVGVLNKVDLHPKSLIAESAGVLPVSAVQGNGLDAFTRRLADIADDLSTPSEGQSILVTNTRHADCLRRGIAALDRADEALDEGRTEEFLAYELREATDALGEIIGAVTTDDILNGIFSRFCIGK